MVGLKFHPQIIISDGGNHMDMEIFSGREKFAAIISMENPIMRSERHGHC